MKRVIFAAVGCAGNDLCPAQAQNYPSRNIRFVVPFTCGQRHRHVGPGPTPIACRLRWARTIVIENMAGGSGISRLRKNVVRSAPDGYTVMITANTTQPATRRS